MGSTVPLPIAKLLLWTALVMVGAGLVILPIFFTAVIYIKLTPNSHSLAFLRKRMIERRWSIVLLAALFVAWLEVSFTPNYVVLLMKALPALK